VTRAASAEDKPPAPAKRTRTIPAKVRSAVWKRDGGRCTFVGEQGHRCGSTHQLEFHHIEAFARGGQSTVANVTLYCNSHNRHAAEKELGAARVAEAIARRRSEGGADDKMAPLLG
jgi:5-methylcytosine-specific restriction endonuclease McrA